MWFKNYLLLISFLLLQAQVLWPADMPDDMLEDAIMVSKTTLDEHEFETNGVEVSFIIFILPPDKT